MKLPIFECQPGLFCGHADDYQYIKPQDGLHLFRTREGKLELFAKRKSSVAGWHLKRGSYVYEFCRSL